MRSQIHGLRFAERGVFARPPQQTTRNARADPLWLCADTKQTRGTDLNFRIVRGRTLRLLVIARAASGTSRVRSPACRQSAIQTRYWLTCRTPDAYAPTRLQC